MMARQQYRMESEFEKECINQMARSTLRKYQAIFEGGQSMQQKYAINIKIGQGYTYSKYNTLMHFLNVIECYWQNPDVNNIQVFGKDVRVLLSISCQKIFFHEGHSYYHYGPFDTGEYRQDLDLSVATAVGNVRPGVARDRMGERNKLIVTDRVYEFQHLKRIVSQVFEQAGGVRVKTDNAVLNLCLLSLLLDLGLFEEHAGLLNLPFLLSLKHGSDTKELQVEISNMIYEFDKKNSADSVTRSKVEELIFEASYKFMVNKNFSVHSAQFQLIRQLNSDPAFHQYVLLCKIYMSLCQINKSVEVDYYKVRCNGEYRIIIPRNFSKTTSDYLDTVTKQYTFSESEGIIEYDEVPLVDVRIQQPEINLYKVRLDSSTDVQSMVKYVEISNVFRAVDSEDRYLFFIADNAMLVDVSETDAVNIRINKIAVEVATCFFNEAISFVPCFKYAGSEDVILFASRNIHYLVDQGGQFCSDYYGMKHELIECIESEECYLDMNDEHCFKKFKLSELVTESKTVFYYPDYLMQVSSRQHLINLLDLAIYVRNISFFILVLCQLRRASIFLGCREKEGGVQKIAGPWKEAILYVLGRTDNTHYDNIFERQFFDLNQHEELSLEDFIEALCDNFTKYQRQSEGQYQIVPTDKQKAFLKRITCAEECFHFSEVGSGKTKVILPLLCQTFLSNNKEAHEWLARGGERKDMLIIMVPEHLLADAKAQVYRHCLNLNFGEECMIHDDIFALMNDDYVKLSGIHKRMMNGEAKRPRTKRIFITTFNQFKKALTNDDICSKVWPCRERMLVVCDEVDDFLNRDKLVFNICSNKNNAFDKPTLQLYHAVSRAVYAGDAAAPEVVESSANPTYWKQLFEKLGAIHTEIQDASRSINKSFGIFNEQTLRHCTTNIAQDIEGYKSLIARPYESVNRAMPGSYYSDVERTIYLTYYILQEDIVKYNELFQQERKFISFEYWSSHLRQLDYDDLVYGTDRLSELVEKHADTKDGLTRFLYEIILRRMEIRDRSRSVNSIDIVFNFDCIGFTGTPFIDNYPTFDYIRSGREDQIPDMIDRSFYAYSSDHLDQGEFEQRFAQFQGRNSNVMVEYVSSDFVQSATDELAILQHIFAQEQSVGTEQGSGFNVLVDLCGLFKRSSIHQVRDLVLRHFGPDRFLYVYHIDQSDGSDRVLALNSDYDVQFDEEFYKYLCKSHGPDLRDKVFFFVDNRNVIGKDIPFQLIYQRRFEQPLFTKSVVLAHDVDDFSKIWQAMGRSRTMNETAFAIYKSGLQDSSASAGPVDIKAQQLTRHLYITNCDRKMAGNLSSIYQTVVSLFNLAQMRFYYSDEIVNVFVEKMEMTIASNVQRHEETLAGYVLGSDMSRRIFAHILADKFRRSSNRNVASTSLTPAIVKELLHHIVQQKFEQRPPSGDVYDDYIMFLSGEQQALMEISYTKQQQKQKQKQQNKNQDSDMMDVFSKKHQLDIVLTTENYFQYTLTPERDLGRVHLNLPISVPIFTLAYAVGPQWRTINVYPTVQFLYSHHIKAEYITPQVKEIIEGFNDSPSFYAKFLQQVGGIKSRDFQSQHSASDDTSLGIGKMVILHGLKSEKYNGMRGKITSPGTEEGRWGVQVFNDEAPESPRRAQSFKEANLKVVPGGNFDTQVLTTHIRQSPQYTLAALEEGVYVIGMKDQFNAYDLPNHPIYDHIQHVAGDAGFMLFDRSSQHTNGEVADIDAFGAYSIELYIMMEMLCKQEVAQNVIDYYINQKGKLQQGLERCDETQGKGFICWRFVMNESVKTA